MFKRFGKPAPMAVSRWRIAERFGWTLEQVDALSVADLTELNAVDDGISKAIENEKQSSDWFKQSGAKR